MLPIQAIALIYTGMLLENPDKRKQFMGYVNNVGASLEKSLKDLTSKGGAGNNVSTAAEESEFK